MKLKYKQSRSINLLFIIFSLLLIVFTLGVLSRGISKKSVIPLTLATGLAFQTVTLYKKQKKVAEIKDGKFIYFTTAKESIPLDEIVVIETSREKDKYVWVSSKNKTFPLQYSDHEKSELETFLKTLSQQSNIPITKSQN